MIGLKILKTNSIGKYDLDVIKIYLQYLTLIIRHMRNVAKN